MNLRPLPCEGSALPLSYPPIGTQEYPVGAPLSRALPPEFCGSFGNSWSSPTFRGSSMKSSLETRDWAEPQDEKQLWMLPAVSRCVPHNVFDFHRDSGWCPTAAWRLPEGRLSFCGGWPGGDFFLIKKSPPARSGKACHRISGKLQLSTPSVEPSGSLLHSLH